MANFTNSITFDDLTLGNFGLALQPGKEHSVLSETRDRIIQIAGRDGSIDFGADLQNRVFNIPLCFPYELTERELQQKVRAFATFLTDKKGKPRNIKLRFDHDVDKFYTVRYSGSLPISRLMSQGYFILSLTAYDPYAYLTDYVGDIILDSDLILESGIRPDDKFDFDVTAPITVNVNNFGDLDIRPLIVVTGSFTNISIATNGKTIICSEPLATGTLHIDNEKYRVYEGGINRNNQVSGDFIELLAGDNEVVISGEGLNCNVSFVFRPKYI